MADNVNKPRGEPALVGLSTHTYNSAAFDIQGFQDCTIADFSPDNFIEHTIQCYEQKKPFKVPQGVNKLSYAKEQGRRRTREAVEFLSNARLNPSQFKKIKLKVILPQLTLVEQIRVKLPDWPSNLDKKRGCFFAQNLRILQVQCFDPFEQSENPMLIRSAFSERITGSEIEINTCGVTYGIVISILCLNKQTWSLFSDLKKAEIDMLMQSAEDLDALDQEVGMISQYQQSAEVDIQDIRIGINDDYDDENIKSAIKKGIMNDDEDDFRILDSLPVALGFQKPQQKQQTVVVPTIKESALKNFVESIIVVGFNANAIPAITNLTYFMNLAFTLSKNGQHDQADQVYFLVASLLITTKRATQAGEVLRKIQHKHIIQIKKGLYELQENQRCNRSSQSGQFKANLRSLCVECAIFELLIADSLQIDSQLQEKIQSLSRMAQFSQGKVPELLRYTKQATSTEDSFSVIIKILPELLRFCIICLANKHELVQISALKILKFIFETQGCSLDYTMVFILKSVLNTFPKTKATTEVITSGRFYQDMLLTSEQDAVGLLFADGPLKLDKSPPSAVICTMTKGQSSDPVSGFKTVINNVYTHVLESFISVLSSVSSHILHSIFYEVIGEYLTNDQQTPQEVRVYSCKIAEKIITICQGDLLISNRMLDSLIEVYCGQKIQLDGQIQVNAQQAMRNLWQSIRQKVFPNYSTKGYRQLIDWVGTRLKELVYIQTPAQELAKRPIMQRNLPDDLSDENLLLLSQLCDVISIVASSRQKSDEEANQLIKLPPSESFGNGTSSELVLVIPQIIFWLEFTLDREDRLIQFQQIYQTLKDVLESLPRGKFQIDIVQVLMPSLERVCTFLEGNSPSLAMLKFLEIAFTDIHAFFMSKCTGKGQTLGQVVPFELQMFFADLLSNYCNYISYSLYDEVFSVFDKLLLLTGDVISEKILKKCILALIDKYTLKSKAHKASLTSFMKSLFDVKIKKSEKRVELEDMLDGELSLQQRTCYFELMCDFCFFDNVDQTFAHDHKTIRGLQQIDFRGATDIHEINVDKLQFFVDSLAMLNDYHINLFTNLITHQSFKALLLLLLDHKETSIRLKSHEILESLTAYFVQYCPSKTVYEFTNDKTAKGRENEMMDAEFISHERLYISQIVIQVARKSLEQQKDCYLQFNALILLDFLFQNLLPVPTFYNEQIKAKRQNKEVSQNLELEQAIDIEMFSISESTPELDVMDPSYLRMRMHLVHSLWPHIQNALASPWSNIRSICYGLVCSMLKINVSDYQQDQADTIPKGVTGQRNSPISPDLSVEKSTFNVLSDELITENLSNANPLGEGVNTATFSRLREIVLPMLYQLLSSKESESKAGGLNILGSFCGLSYDFTGVKINKHLQFLQRNSKFISLPVWKLVYNLQDDWDVTIKEASVVLVQLCAPRNAVGFFKSQKDKQKQAKFDYIINTLQNPACIYQEHSQNQSADTASLDRRLLDFDTREFDKDPMSVRSYLVRKSATAAKALSIFAQDRDKDIVLERYPLKEEANLIGGSSLVDFLSGRKIGSSDEPISLSSIEQENQILSGQIDKYMPNYEDQRFQSGPMTRKRQLELEFDLKRNAKADPKNNTGFFVDQYSDEQILEIISIFRNDFKPPKNLWIEKQPSPQTLGSGHGGPIGSPVQPLQSFAPDYFQDIYADAIESFNAQQAHLQQLQQAQLQQQVSSGSSLSSNSSESEGEDIQAKIIVDSEDPKSMIEITSQSTELKISVGRNSPVQKEPIEAVKIMADNSTQVSATEYPSKISVANHISFEENTITNQEQSQMINENTKTQNGEKIDLQDVQTSKQSIQSDESKVQRDQKKENRGIQKWIIRQMLSKPDKFIDQIKGLKEVIASQKADKKRLSLVVDELFNLPESPDEHSISLPTETQQSKDHNSSQHEGPSGQKSSRLAQRTSRLAQVVSEVQPKQEQASFLPIPQPNDQSQSKPIFEKFPEPQKHNQEKQKMEDKENIQVEPRQKKRGTSKSFIAVTKQRGNHLRLEENVYATVVPQDKTPQASVLIPKPSKSKENKRQPGGSASMLNLNMAPPQTTKNKPLGDLPRIMESSTYQSQVMLVNQSQNTNSQTTHLTQKPDEIISRKTAQTYLSGLTKSQLLQIDNMQLVSNCLSVTQPNNPQLVNLSKKAFNKSFEFTGTQKSQRGKKSRSPQRGGNDSTSGQGRKSSKARKSSVGNKYGTNGSDHKNKSQVLNGSSQKQINKLADLNFFIKSIEKDLNEQYKTKNSLPHTPNALLRKVEDQIKALGQNNSSNPNLALLLQNIEAQSQSAENLKKNLAPQLKILALREALVNQITFEHTPSNISLTSSQPNILGLRHMSAASPGKSNTNIFCKLSQSNLKQAQTNRDNSEGRGDIERSLSSGRGANSNSAERVNNTLLPISSQHVLMTDRNHRSGTGTRRNISGERAERSRDYKRDHKDDKLAPTVRFASKAKKPSDISKKKLGRANPNSSRNNNSFAHGSIKGPDQSQVDRSANQTKPSTSQAKANLKISKNQVNQKELLISIVGGSTSVKNSSLAIGMEGGRFFPSSTRGNLTNRFNGNESASQLYDLIQQSQQSKKKQQDMTDKAVKNLKVKNSEKPPRREKEFSPLSPDMQKHQVTTTSSEYQFATLQVAKTQRDADRNKSNSGVAQSRQVLSPQGVAIKQKPTHSQQHHYV